MKTEFSDIHHHEIRGLPRWEKHLHTPGGATRRRIQKLIRVATSELGAEAPWMSSTVRELTPFAGTRVYIAGEKKKLSLLEIERDPNPYDATFLIDGAYRRVIVSYGSEFISKGAVGGGSLQIHTERLFHYQPIDAKKHTREYGYGNFGIGEVIVPVHATGCVIAEEGKGIVQSLVVFPEPLTSSQGIDVYGIAVIDTIHPVHPQMRSAEVLYLNSDGGDA